jgi:hypothetical protein
MKKLLTLVFALSLCAVPAMAQWVEQGDAGDQIATAQIPIGSGALATIAGTIDANDVDMFCFQTADPATFVAQTCGTGATWDTQLFIFRPDGVAVTWDDDTCDPGLQSLINGFSSCQYNLGPGQYYVAISKYNRDPLSAAGAALVPTASGCNTLAAAALASWGGTTTVAGAYTITFTNAEFCGTVATEPTTWGTVKSLYR